MCGLSSFTAADAICRYMNFARASRWTLKDGSKSDFDDSGYNRYMSNVDCSSAEWKSCTYSLESSCRDAYNVGVFLSCSGTIY